MLPPPFRVQASPANHRGRDFVVGDIHGRFDRLQSALRHVNFDGRFDRLFALGDLIDRGPRSYEALQWLQHPWFFSILGNHELLYLHWCALKNDLPRRANYEEKQYFQPNNGGAWCANHGEELHGPLEAALQKLPTLRAVTTRKGEILILVHAQLPDGCQWPQMLTQDWPDHLRDQLAWGRSRWQQRHEGTPWRLEGADAVVVGHTTVAEPLVLGNVLYLDTGGWQPRPQNGFTVMTLEDILERVRQQTIALPPSPL